MGPNGSGKSTLSYILAGRDGLRGHRGRHPLQRPVDPRNGPGRARRRGHLPRLPVSDGDTGRGDHGVPEGRDERAAQGARRGAAEDPGLHQAREGGRRLAQHGHGDAEAAAQCRLLRRREEARRDPADEAAGAEALRARRDRFRPRHRRAEDRRRRRQRAALARPRDRRHHPLPAPARTHRAGQRARALQGPGHQVGRQDRWRSSWKPTAMPASSARRHR